MRVRVTPPLSKGNTPFPPLQRLEWILWNGLWRGVPGLHGGHGPPPKTGSSAHACLLDAKTPFLQQLRQDAGSSDSGKGQQKYQHQEFPSTQHTAQPLEETDQVRRSGSRSAKGMKGDPRGQVLGLRATLGSHVPP